MFIVFISSQLIFIFISLIYHRHPLPDSFFDDSVRFSGYKPYCGVESFKLLWTMGNIKLSGLQHQFDGREICFDAMDEYGVMFLPGQLRQFAWVSFLSFPKVWQSAWKIQLFYLFNHFISLSCSLPPFNFHDFHIQKTTMNLPVKHGKSSLIFNFNFALSWL